MSLFDRFRRQPAPGREEAEKRLAAAQARLKEQRTIDRLQRAESQVARTEKEQSKSVARRYVEQRATSFLKNVATATRQGVARRRQAGGGVYGMSTGNIGGPFVNQPVGKNPFTKK